MKIIVIGDIHGRTIWTEILYKENPDKVICLGDYVGSHEGISGVQQIMNYRVLMDCKESEPDKFILLRGNHDMQHLGYYWAECCSLNREVLEYFSNPENKEKFLKNTQWIHIDEDLKTIFSHAGVSEGWMKYYHIDDIYSINDIKPSPEFGFTSNNYFDQCGESIIQPPTWIRPASLCESNIIGWDQVVGHTSVTRNIVNIHKTARKNQNIWLCDALALNQYLIIENGEFKIGRLTN